MTGTNRYSSSSFASSSTAFGRLASLSWIPQFLDFVASLLELFLAVMAEATAAADSSTSSSSSSPRQKGDDDNNYKYENSQNYYHHHKSHCHHDDDDNDNDDTVTHDKTLLAAYDFFETTSSIATYESIKKKYRKLSLLHHPDRNGNTEHSVWMMQKVNNYYTIITTELDARQKENSSSSSIHEQGQDDNQEEENDEDYYEQSEKKQTTFDKSYREKKKKRKKKKKKKKQESSNKYHRKQREYYHQEQQQQEEEEEWEEEWAKQQQEIHQEWEEMQNKRSALDKEQRKHQKDVQQMIWEYDLNTVQGRYRANQEWEEAIGLTEGGGGRGRGEQGRSGEGRSMSSSSSSNNSVQEAQHKQKSQGHTSNPVETKSQNNSFSNMHDIDDGDGDDDDDQNGPSYSSPMRTTSPSTASSSPSLSSLPSVTTKNNKKKVKNLIMECKNDDHIIVALRMKLFDMAIDLIQEEIEDSYEIKVMEEVLQFDETLLRTTTGSRVLLESILTDYLHLPLDADGNTLLHYAAYYECIDVIDYIAQLATSIHKLPDIFLKENIHGHIPLVYCCCYYCDINTTNSNNTTLEDEDDDDDEVQTNNTSSPQNDSRQRLEHWTDAARDQVPSFDKTIRRIKVLLGTIDMAHHVVKVPAILLNLITMVLVGTHIFEAQIIPSFFFLVVTLAVLYPLEDDKKEDIQVEGVGPRCLFTCHWWYLGVGWIWQILFWDGSWVRFVTSCIMILGIPTCCGYPTDVLVSGVASLTSSIAYEMMKILFMVAYQVPPVITIVHQQRYWRDFQCMILMSLFYSICWHILAYIF